MSEKSFSEELKAVLSACTFADLARAVESSSRRWQTNPSYARAADAFEGSQRAFGSALPISRSSTQRT